MTFAAMVTGICVIGFAVYYGIGWIKDVAGDAAIYIVGVLVGRLCRPAEVRDHLSRNWRWTTRTTRCWNCRRPGPTVKAGLYFLLPIVVLMWCLIVERFSPGLSAFWATVLMIFIVLTQRPLLAFFRGQRSAGRS